MTFSTATDEAQKESFFFQKPKYNHQLNGILTDQLLEISNTSLVDPCNVFFFLLYMQAVAYHLEALPCV